MTARTEDIAATDGSGSFAGAVTLPAAGSGPGLVLLQEIFGVNDYILDVGRRLAELGYVTLRSRPVLAPGARREARS